MQKHKHTIIVGNELEIDNCTYFTKIVGNANSISIINIYNTQTINPKLTYGSAIKGNTDVVLVYTNNIQIDYISFIQYALRDLNIIMRRIHFIFLAQTPPFKLKTYITSHFNILTASRSLNQTIRPNKLRLKSKVLKLQNSIHQVQRNKEYSLTEKNLFTNYLKKQLVDQEHQVYNQ